MKSIEKYSREELEQALAAKEAEEAAQAEIETKLKDITPKLEAAQREYDAAKKVTAKYRSQIDSLRDNIRQARENEKVKADVVRDLENAVREITGKPKRAYGEGTKPRSEGFGERDPKTVVLDTIRNAGKPITITEVADKIITEGNYKGQSSSAYIAANRVAKELLADKVVAHAPQGAEGDQRKNPLVAV